jgi:hypothetical protein
MNPEQRIKLHELVTAHNSVDNTRLIRDLKHSELILKDVNTLLRIKAESSDKASLESTAARECNFLYSRYTHIYNRLLRDQIDVMVLYTFLGCLKKIEDGQLDQHEASFEIGSLLKRMYVDPKIDKEPEFTTGKNISWQEYKNKLQ